MTGKVPSQQQTDDLVLDLANRSEISPSMEKLIDAFRGWHVVSLHDTTSHLPLILLTAKELHPMTQFIMAVAALK